MSLSVISVLLCLATLGVEADSTGDAYEVQALGPEGMARMPKTAGQVVC